MYITQCKGPPKKKHNVKCEHVARDKNGKKIRLFIYILLANGCSSSKAFILYITCRFYCFKRWLTKMCLQTSNGTWNKRHKYSSNQILATRLQEKC